MGECLSYLGSTRNVIFMSLFGYSQGMQMYLGHSSDPSRSCDNAKAFILRPPENSFFFFSLCFSEKKCFSFFS